MSKSTDKPDTKPKKKVTASSKTTKTPKRKSKKSENTSTPADTELLLQVQNDLEEGEKSDVSGSRGGSEIVHLSDEDMSSESPSFSEESDLQAAQFDAEDDDGLPINPENIFELESDEEILNRIAGVYQIWWNWAHFELLIVSPYIESLEPSVLIHPEQLSEGELEFVYPICDYGNKLVTSKGPEMYSAGMSMCKLYYTIEKMISILIERLQRDGISTETEVQIAFDGHQLAQRKAFESVINLSYNVVVTNFDPGAWGEKYLAIVKRLAEKGYGYPAGAPRDLYRKPAGTSMKSRR